MLNPQQQMAVEAIAGPVLVVASPGSGKTRVIIARIEHLLKQGYSPRQILAVTFTRAAAMEMRRRLDNMKLDDKHEVTISTFHGLAARILREQGYHLGYRPNYSIYDENDQLDILKSVLADMNRKKPSPETVLDQLDTPRYADVKAEYRDRVRSNNAMDYDMLIENALVLLRRPEIADIYASRYQYISIDEFQDLNGKQYEMTRILASQSRNICAVGDPDQCLVRGTLISTPNGASPIETLSVGDLVMSNCGHMFGEKPQRITAVSRKMIHDVIYSIKTASGAVVKCTGDHHVPAKWEKGVKRWHYVYVEHNKKLGWRIGVTSDPVTRLSLEKRAEGLLPIAAFKNKWDALVLESILSCKFGIPKNVFSHRGGKKEMPDKKLEEIFSALATNYHAEKLLEHVSKRWDGFIRQQGNTGKQYSRQNVNVYVLDGIYGSASSPFFVSYESNGKRIRSRFPSLVEARTKAKSVCARNPKAYMHELWHLGKNIRAKMVPACNLLPGISVIVDGKLEEVVEVETEQYKDYVYDIEVEHAHNFILSNGIIVGNCIMEFQGSNIRYILDFTKDYPDAKVINLDTCYRCPTNILECADSLIRNNRERLEKKTAALGNTFGKIKKLVFDDDLEEASWIAAKCKELKADGVTAYHNMAILARTHMLKNLIANALLDKDIPINVCGKSEDFYKSKIITEVIDYLRVVVNPHDEFSFKRIIDKAPREYIPYPMLLKALSFARAANIDYVTGAKMFFSRPPNVVEQAVELCDSLTKWREEMQNGGSSSVIHSIVNMLIQRWREQNLGRRVELLKELISRYSSIDPSGFPTIEEFLNYISELNEQDDVENKAVISEPEEAVQIMTVHTAKGLEFDTVFIPGMDIGVFPISAAVRNIDEMEQERRLLYVGVTRSEENLFLTRSRQRARYWTDNPEQTEPSPFLDELSLPE